MIASGRRSRAHQHVPGSSVLLLQARRRLEGELDDLFLWDAVTLLHTSANEQLFEAASHDEYTSAVGCVFQQT